MKKTKKKHLPIKPRHVNVPSPAAHRPHGRRWLIAGGVAGLLFVVFAYSGWQLFGHSTKDPGKDEEEGPPALNTTQAPAPSSEVMPALTASTVGLLGAPSGQGSMLAASGLFPGRTGEPGMVWVPGGWFWMGSEDFPDTQPIHKVYVDGFWMDRTPVTNAQFEAFVKATNYVTVAERVPDINLYSREPGTPLPEVAKAPYSHVFAAKQPTAKAEPVDVRTPWWWAVPGACWRHPEGRDSDTKGRENHPAVHICWHDAVAYARWAKKRLPTEAEFEFAARGGLHRKRYCWGDEATPGGKFMANYWQGVFPEENTREDGFAGTSPVGSYPANGYGLFDMAGNVWQWCADWYKDEYYQESPERNPQGPTSSFNPNETGTPFRVQRGGSFLCADSYCKRYVPGARHAGDPLSAAVHNGFRCVRAPR